MTEYTHEEVDQMFTKISGMFDHIRNTFVNASELAQKVSQLEQRVTELSDQAEAMRQHNINLDEALAHTRQERDAAQSEVSSLRHENAALVQERDSHRSNAEYWSGKHNEVQATLEQTKHDLYQNQEYSRALENENEELKKQLEAIKEAHRKIFGDPPVSGGWPQAVNQ